MAEIANPNLSTYLRDTANRRTGEVAGADWTGGMNDGASCAPGVGINTGDYDPKASDWSRDVRLSQESQQIGQSTVALEVIQGADVNDKVSFVQADNNAAPDTPLTTGGPVNRTGKTVPNGSWAWGTVTTA